MPLSFPMRFPRPAQTPVPPKHKLIKKMVRPAGVEPTAFGSGGRRSIQLSYGRTAVNIMRFWKTLASNHATSLDAFARIG